MIFEKDNNKKNVLFIHGFGSNHNFWLPLKSIERKYNMIAVSLNLKENSSFETFAEQIKDFIEENKIKDLTIVGHSMGCSVAFFLNKIHPINKLILLSPHNAFITNKEETKKWVMPTNMSDAVESFENLVFDISIWKNNIELMAERYLNFVKAHYDKLNALFQNSIFNDKTKSNLSNLYEQISIPTSIITGMSDKFVSIESVNKMKKYGFNIIELENTGHAILTEKPNEIARLIAQEIEV